MGNNTPPNVPPQNIEAEQSVIGAILLENEALTQALEILKPMIFIMKLTARFISVCLSCSKKVSLQT